jgi:hypothetical protein
VSCPVAFGAALHAFRRAPDRVFACLALALSAPQVAVWGWLMLTLLVGFAD